MPDMAMRGLDDGTVLQLGGDHIPLAIGKLDLFPNFQRAAQCHVLSFSAQTFVLVTVCIAEVTSTK